MSLRRARTVATVATVATVTCVAALAACGAVERFPEWLLDARTPRERYEARLGQAGLSATAMVRDWIDAADAALRDAPLVESPHEEEGYLSPARPAALGYRVEARRGQRIAFEIVLPGDSLTETFVDLWAVGTDSAATLTLVASADSGQRTLSHAPRRDGMFLFRVQPELMRGGRFRVAVRVAPMLAFPVQGRSARDVGSRFGAPRDGGRRSHHGLDIFAPRGTPAIAGAAATVRRVDRTEIGGNVVWLRDDFGHSLYYAHLDRATVVQGTRVEPGDTVGLVGNTGNARTTPPHLHFGIYARGEGPIDPWWFVRPLAGRLPALVADTALLGEWGRTRAATAAVRAAPGEDAAVRIDAPRHTALEVMAAVGRWFRVRLPDGTAGYVRAEQVEAARTAVATIRAGGPAVLSARPGRADAAEVLAEVAAGDAVDLLGRFGEHRLIRDPAGRAGWMSP